MPIKEPELQNQELHDERASASWRDVLPIHPAAEMFPLMAPDELAVLGADIKTNGLISPIVLWLASKEAQAQLLDGRNRFDALEVALGRPVRVTSHTFRGRTTWSLDADDNGDSVPVIDLLGNEGFPAGTQAESVFVVLGPDTDPYAYVTAANLHRRHLSTEQKRDLIAKLIKATPDKSDRQIAETVKADHKTVGAVRAKQEARGEIPHVEARIDTMGRRQPRSAQIYREAKLGAEVVVRLEGTSLDNARELDELVVLNRGASEGELTEPVRDLVASAVRGEKVSAIEYTKSGAAYRRDPVAGTGEVLQQREAAAERIRALTGDNKVGTDSESASGNASDEQGRLRHFEFQNIALRSEIEELKAQVRSLEDRGLRAVPLEKLFDELEHRLPATLPKKHLKTLKALRGALGEHHLGPTLNLDFVADSEATKH
jgi:hypothetical protein